MSAPVIAITLGDVAGIGPEISMKALADAATRGCGMPLLIGHPEIADRALKLAKLDLKVEAVSSPRPVEQDGIVACWLPPEQPISVHGSQRIYHPQDCLDVRVGEVDWRAGAAAYVWLVAATRLALSHKIDAIVTAPLHKKALELAGLNYPGHTEILAEECGVDEYAMMLYVPPGRGVGGRYGLGCAHVTLHTSIRSVPELLRIDDIRDTAMLVSNFLKQVGCENPRIGVCALNPHSGEHGRFGDEEARLILPAVEEARELGIDAHGPIPADALMRRAIHGEFDGVAAMYHDQGHIALKLVAFNQAVNVTLGLPIIRTSPSHGTAFDIAGQGVADATGMIAAMATAMRLVDCRDGLLAGN
ncbi:MAG TPA: 4-hydroxythreonine-4-phosphate dehydrogenase PdxA [Caulifigura sp.]|jgi:4-hydroxythreonine-4-phosphate dehydrogenase|nr:4-hydroxythreonine-4-phosphate dehydrogenase PdxA [Caulifigura sp.]